ncbi:MAG TPA: glycerophosphodiester phosphodiesterase family protein, partial [Candidatus Limnocylindria bacterium]|nr:glycerophosphodiester phosphodiesterase family protein [Candidatus Limnocylindria bacterium]
MTIRVLLRRLLLALVGAAAIYLGAQWTVLRAEPRSNVQVIAHRGGLGQAPEGTMTAFRSAIEAGADWIEFDVRLTSDGVPVVMHDATVERTTSARGAVADLTLQELRRLDAGDGNPIPTLEGVLALGVDAGVGLLPEAKEGHLYPGLVEAMIEVITAAGARHVTVVQSFDADTLERFRALAPDLRLCALYGTFRFDLTRPPADAEFVCPMAEMVLINPAMIRAAHGDGRTVFVWFGPTDSEPAYR